MRFASHKLPPQAVFWRGLVPEGDRPFRGWYGEKEIAGNVTQTRAVTAETPDLSRELSGSPFSKMGLINTNDANPNDPKRSPIGAQQSAAPLREGSDADRADPRRVVELVGNSN